MMKNQISKLILFIIFIVATSMSCEKQDIDPAGHYRIAKEYSISSDLSFTINSISDSRCPEGAVCVWEGDVSMDFQIKEGNRVIDTTMNLQYHHNNPSEFGGFAFEIQDVIPYPKLGEEIDLDEVRIIMQLHKL